MKVGMSVKPLKTQRQAEIYVDWLKREAGVEHSIFKVPEGTSAWHAGFRFGTCTSAERESYEAMGAEFVS